MINGKRVLAVIPARGGSKGVPLKNIREFNGVPLVALVAPVVKAVAEIDRAVVSTDHPEIKRIAEEAGLDVPFTRPPELSGDQIADWDVLVHAVTATEKDDGKKYDVVLMLQPTSPLRTAAHVRSVLQKIAAGKKDSVWTVTEMDVKNHPLKALTLEDDKLDYFDSRGASIIARQQLSKTYIRNGVAYAFTRECLFEQKKILGKNAGAVVIKEVLINIDSEEDFKKIKPKSDSTPGIEVVATFTANPGKEKDLEKVLRYLVDETHREPGCLHYSLHRASEDPAGFFFVEKWASKKDLDAHFATKHVQLALQKKDELVKSMAIVQVEPLGGGNAQKNSI